MLMIIEKFIYIVRFGLLVISACVPKGNEPAETVILGGKYYTVTGNDRLQKR